MNFAYLSRKIFVTMENNIYKYKLDVFVSVNIFDALEKRLKTKCSKYRTAMW
jgi:hypothetical protein